VGIQFEVNRSDLRKFRWTNHPESELKDGQIKIFIDKFGFSSNNVTYANLGNSFGYWNFFPVDNVWGIIPTWGFGTVIESNHKEISLGERFYGYYPTASHLVLEPGKVRPTGFSDTKEHRTKLPSAYNFYYNTTRDEFYTKESEDFQLIYRPLFTTSFLLESYLLENQFFTAKDVLITSASSKTAIALAYLLKLNREKNHFSFKIHALTSNRNLSLVQSLGYYDKVKCYEDLGSFDKSDICVVDFSGNEKIQSEIKLHFGSHHKHLCLVGMVHWEEQAQDQKESQGVLFFAPAEIKKKSKHWGLAGFQEKLVHSFGAYAKDSSTWMKYKNLDFSSSFENVYLETLEGKFPAELGAILSNS